MAESLVIEKALAAGGTALSAGAWSEARAAFEVGLSTAPSPALFEGLSWALWWLEDSTACLDARERAYNGFRQSDDARGAARMALWLSDDHNEFLAASAVAEGWLRRAARILEGMDPCEEHGWLAAFKAHSALARQDYPVALRQAREAQEYGRHHGSVDLQMFGLASEGVVLIAQGNTPEGLICLDEATAAAINGEYSNLVPAAWACCLMMSTCEQLRDIDRGAQWCREIDNFSRKRNVNFVVGVCGAHLGIIQLMRGNWAEAETSLTRSLEDLTTRRPAWRAEALVRLAQLRLPQGRLEEAAALFEQAPDHPLAIEGKAGLSLMRNDPLGARDLLERILRQSTSPPLVSQVGALELLVRACDSLEDHRSAAEYLEDLRLVAELVQTPHLVATVAVCQGLIAASKAGYGDACDQFEDAIDGFIRARTPVHAAIARLELAGTLIHLKRFDVAKRETLLAIATFESIGAHWHLARSRAVLQNIQRVRAGIPAANRLTNRQIEVLRLVAAGLSDQEIAAELMLSHHTIHRHIANIFNRLSCSTRAAAVAEAGRRGFL